MQKLLFVTSNTLKFHTAQTLCRQFGLQLEQLAMEIPEIQAHDGETVACDKALRVFEDLQKPLIISDDSWLIPGLNNFPGPFMKFVNASFTSQDWLRLTKPLTDRRIILRQIIIYQDQHQQQLFYNDIEGILLKEIRGRGPYPHNSITSFDAGKTSLAEHDDQGTSAVAASQQHTSWHTFCEWYRLKT